MATSLQSKHNSNDSELVTELIHKYSELEPGTTVSGLVCPKCDGGSTRERSFNVSCVEEVSSRNNSTLKWMCHRSSCGFKGTLIAGDHSLRQARGESEGAHSPPVKVEAPTLEERIGPLNEVPSITKDYLINERYLTEQTITKCGLRWSPRYHRLYIPLRDAQLSTIGCVLRSFDKSRQPKTLTFYEKGATSTLGWFTAGRDGLLYIVEDVFSAMRLQQFGISAISLCGTNLNDARLLEVAANGGKSTYNPVLALDLDALGKAVDVMRHARSFLPSIQVRKITKDFKDLTPQELEDYFK